MENGLPVRLETVCFGVELRAEVLDGLEDRLDSSGKLVLKATIDRVSKCSDFSEEEPLLHQV